MSRLQHNTLILGTQWGDEGKGKITHYLSRRAQVVARYAGGNNAGHTVVIGDETYKLHLIPSGIFFEHVLCLLGNGMVIDPQVLLSEIDGLRARGVPMHNLKVSPLAHVILPYHRWLDQSSEKRRGDQNIGTTGRGIGPAYSDKTTRVGIRVMDLLDADFLRQRIEFNFKEKQHLLEGSDLRPAEVCETYRDFGERLRPFVADVSMLLCDRIKAGDKVIFEGAQGALLDIDLGTYPYVTSSNAGPGYAGAGVGCPPRAIEKVLGVVKAYTTRVGSGPFPTELLGPLGDKMREQGGEFGTTTGRPRRCGWLDLVALRTAFRVHGVDAISITKLDVLSGFDPIEVCVAYDLDGVQLKEFPLSVRDLERCKPVYVKLDGWTEPLAEATTWDALPAAAARYLRRIEDELGVPVEMVSVGAREDLTLERPGEPVSR
jgi:adenylosuccinate synthase